MMTPPLFSADSFYERLETPSLGWPLLIWIVGSSLIGLGSLILVLPDVPAPQGLSTVDLVVLGVIFLVSTIITLILTAGIFYVISAVLGGEGSLKKTVAYLGWGSLPTVIWGVTDLVSSVYLLSRGVSILTYVESSNPEIIMLKIFDMLFVLWQGYVWMFAIKHARMLSRRRAAITIGVPTLVYIAFLVYQLVNFLDIFV